ARIPIVVLLDFLRAPVYLELRITEDSADTEGTERRSDGADQQRSVAGARDIEAGDQNIAAATHKRAGGNVGQLRRGGAGSSVVELDERDSGATARGAHLRRVAGRRERHNQRGIAAPVRESERTDAA